MYWHFFKTNSDYNHKVVLCKRQEFEPASDLNAIFTGMLHGLFLVPSMQMLDLHNRTSGVLYKQTRSEQNIFEKVPVFASEVLCPMTVHGYLSIQTHSDEH